MSTGVTVIFALLVAAIIIFFVFEFVALMLDGARHTMIYKIFFSKRKKYKDEQECLIPKYQTLSLQNRKHLKDYPTITLATFKDFYYVNPNSWALNEYYVQKNNDYSLVMTFSYHEWKKYAKFRQQIREENENRVANKNMMERLEWQDEVMRKVCEAVQKDIDNIRANTAKQMVYAENLINAAKR